MDVSFSHGNSRHYFKKLSLPELRPVAVVAQCLDNQWVVTQELERLRRRRTTGVLGGFANWIPRKTIKKVDWSVAQRQTRLEYIRSLVMAEQVVVNRSFIYNNPIVFSDFEKTSPSRAAFLSLIGSQAIVAYLFNEANPLERLETDLEAQRVRDPAQFSISKEGAEAWVGVCAEQAVACVRLSWDDRENETEIHQRLRRQAHNRLVQLGTGDSQQFLTDLRGLIDAEPDKDEVSAFKKHLQSLKRFVDDEYQKTDKFITRETIYRKFVIMNGTEPHQRIYDGTKPFMVETKQLVDLVYNTNLTDALQVQTLTPAGSPPRLALQELRERSRPPTETNADVIFQTVKDLRFGIIQQALDFIEFDNLTLDDVIKIRQTEAWRDYVNAVADAVRDDTLFGEAAVSSHLPLIAVHQAYFGLIAEISKVQVDATIRRIKLPPAIQLIFRLGTAVAVATWLPNNLLIQIGGGLLAERQMELAVTIGIGWWQEKTTELVNATNIELGRRKVSSARSQWETLCRQLRDQTISPFTELRGNQSDEAYSTLNQEME